MALIVQSEKPKCSKYVILLIIKVEKEILMIIDTPSPSWEPLLTRWNEQLLYIEKSIATGYNPSKENILRFTKMDVKDIKVVILGQDPYPAMEDGVATGLAFEVGNLHSWLQPFRQVSLKNIVRLLYKTETGKLPSFSKIREEIAKGDYVILPPDELFKSWESQGVLLLNTSLTVMKGKPGSHKSLWNDFTSDLISYISYVNPDIDWFLWGGHAKGYTNVIRSGRIHAASHPRINSTNEGDFLDSACFSKTWDKIKWK